MKTHSVLISFVFILSVKLSIWGNGLLTAIPDLSSQAIESLVAHYDGSKGVETDGNTVVSWTPVDSNGQLLDEMIEDDASDEEATVVDVPDYKNWTADGAVTKVKNQWFCGA